MTDTKIQQRSMSFDAAKSKFSNNGLPIDSLSNESIDSIGKKFKYEVKFPGVIHTTTRKNNVGDGLNELNARANSAVSKPSVVKSPMQELNPFRKLRERSESVSSSSSASDSQNVAESIQTVSNGRATNVMRTFGPKMRKLMADNNIDIHESINTPDTQRRDSGISLCSDVSLDKKAKTYNPLDWNPIYQGKKRFIPDRFKVRPFLCSDIDGYVAPDKRNRNLERCMVTHDGSKLEAEMERKHGFQLDPSIKHMKADTVVCSITKGHDRKGVKFDASHKQEPLSEVSKVNVKELAKRFIN